MVDGSWLENRFLQGAEVFKECCRTVAPSINKEDKRSGPGIFIWKESDVLQSLYLDGLEHTILYLGVLE